MRQYWRDPEFWRWWWENRVGREVKVLLLVMVLGVFAAGGYALAAEASKEPTVVLGTERVLTVVRSKDGKTVTNVLTEMDTTTRSSTETETDLVTLTRDGEAVVIQRPGSTVTDTNTRTVRGPTKVVTDTRTVDRSTTVTNTVDRTTTQTQTNTVTGPGQTVTNTTTVPGPTSTVTETDEVTVTETETVTETVPPGKNPP